jgi:hypothetical protein
MFARKSISDADHSCTPTERRNNRRYQMEYFGATGLYVAMLFASVAFVDRVPTGAGKVALALLPMVGVIGMSVALIRFMARIDELQRQNLILCGAIAGLVTAIATMALGFLENAGVPRISMTFVWPFTMLVFGACVPFMRRRYR